MSSALDFDGLRIVDYRLNVILDFSKLSERSDNIRLCNRPCGAEKLIRYGTDLFSDFCEKLIFKSDAARRSAYDLIFQLLDLGSDITLVIYKSLLSYILFRDLVGL